MNDDAETALRRRYQGLEELGRAGVWEWDIRQERLVCSQGLLGLLELHELEHGHRFEPMLRRVALEDRETVREAIETALATRDRYAVEYRCLLPDGRIRWLRARGRVDVDEQGIPVRLFSACSDLTEDRHLVEWLAASTLEDPLTGLVSRFVVDDRLQQAMRRTRQPRAGTTVLYIDIDDFRRINQELGFQNGDEVLRGFAQRLRRVVRGGDTAGRYGGDELVAICEEIPSAEEALAVGRRLHEALRMRLSSFPDEITASVGIAIARPAETPHAVIARAANAAVRARRDGSGTAMSTQDQ